MNMAAAAAVTVAAPTDARVVAHAAASFPRRCVDAAIFAPMLQLATDHGYSVFDIPDNWLRQHGLDKNLVVAMLTERDFSVVHGYDGITALAQTQNAGANGSRAVRVTIGAAAAGAGAGTEADKGAGAGAGKACVISSTTVAVAPKHT